MDVWELVQVRSKQEQAPRMATGLSANPNQLRDRFRFHPSEYRSTQRFSLEPRGYAGLPIPSFESLGGRLFRLLDALRQPAESFAISGSRPPIADEP